MLMLALPACSPEQRLIASDQPQTPPNGPDDPRTSQYQVNYYQVAQGGRYFTWYGCGQCHAAGATGVLDLGDGQWRHGSTIDRVYAFIAAHPGAPVRYGGRIPTEQLWQITAYVRDLERQDAAKIRRQTVDQAGEPQAAIWAGPVK